MRITIMALGSHGDIQPQVWLGQALGRAGHRVRLSTFESFGDIVHQAGLDFHPVKGDAQAVLNTSPALDLAESGSNPLRLIVSIMRTYGDLIDDYIEAFTSDALLDSEAIINQIPAGFFGRELAEKLRVPHLMSAVLPVTATRTIPMLLLPHLPLGSLYNRFSYRVGELLAWVLFRGPINRYRARLGLPANRSFFAFSRAVRSTPVINGFSRHVVPHPPDWPPHVHTTGWWQPEDDGYTPPDDLMAFLNAGTPPVFVGFGSMPSRDPARLTQTVLEGIARSGQRGILSSGWAGLTADNLPDNVFQVGFVPYTWLFPRMAVVVHHGGSGTTGMALRSGVPSLVVPFLADQPYWGRRVAELGVGPPPIPFKSLTPDRLAAAIRTAVTDPDMRSRAAALGAKLRAENGLQTAVQIIQQYLDSNKHDNTPA